MEHTSSANIAEALKLLEEAAKLKKDELKSAMTDKYTNLKSIIMESEVNFVKSLTAAKDHALEAATHAREAGLEKAHEISRDVDKDVHKNPWPYIAGSAVLGLLLGCLLGRNPK